MSSDSARPATYQLMRGAHARHVALLGVPLRGTEAPRVEAQQEHQPGEAEEEEVLDEVGHAQPSVRRRRWRDIERQEPSPVRSTARKASWGISTLPTRFMRCLPSFCFSSSLRLRVMSPP